MRQLYQSIINVVVMGLVACAVSPVAHGETITIYRDGFGIPHIFAESEVGCAFAMGYVQGEDRLEGVLKNYLRAEGRMAEAFGEAYLDDDLKARMFQHYAKSKEHYGKKSQRIREITEAFVAGLKHYMQLHPDETPAWAPEVTPYHISAVGRYLIWGWPEGEAAGDLRRGGISYAPDDEYRGSNQWLVAPSRTEAGVPIALIDPHLSWYGFFRFYEARYYGGELAYSGMAVPGLPLATLGHSRYCSVAMTTGGPDTADIFSYPVNPDNPLEYRYDGAWRVMTVMPETIRVKREDGGFDRVDVEFHYTHTGPVVARENGRANAMAIPYWEEIYHIDQVYAMNTARNMEDMMDAFSMRQYMAQNIMVGTVDGDIFYLRNGRVPIRPAGFDYQRPVPGEDPASAWRGIHPIADLVQILNPASGYMQNNNVTPYRMMKDSPLIPKKYPDYIYGAGKSPAHQRAAMTLEHLHVDDHVTREDAFEIAMSTQVYGADRWQMRLRRTITKAMLPEDQSALANRILTWDRHADATSRGATCYYYWKRALWEDSLSNEEQRWDRYGQPPPETLTDADILDALGEAAATMRAVHGSLAVPYGQVFRVGRRNADGSYSRTFPVDGGNPGYGMATPRNIGFRQIDDGLFVGQSGQTSTQVVVLSKPPQSWTYLPLGESDDPESPHYDDQAEELFSPRRMKSTFFMDKAALMENVTSKTVLGYSPGG